MILRLIFMIIAFLIVIFVLGRGLLVGIKGDKSLANTMLIGFLSYFSLFEILAFFMTIFFRSLTELACVWGIVLAILCVLCMSNSEFWQWNNLQYKNSTIRKMIPTVFIIFVLGSGLVYFMINSNINGWDAAFYAGGVNTFVYTDSMYIYEGTTGWKESYLNLRYVISSFWTHDAVLAKVFFVHGTIVCKYFNASILALFSMLVVYELGKQVFKDGKRGYQVVAVWILANFTVLISGASNHFLLLRGMENKSYCANLIIPIVFLYIIKIWEDSNNSSNWIYLFIANFASVAISGSSLILIPVINGCCLSAHWIITRKMKDFIRMVICVLPCLLYLIIYALYLLGWWQIRIVA